jgi:cobalt/nickel transport system permease protein
MAGVHALIGIGEGLITIGALASVRATRPDLLQAGGSGAAKGGLVWSAGLLIAIALAVVSPLASANPDGLEWVAARQGFLDAARGPLYRIIPDYVFPGVSNEALATILAGVAGTVFVFGVALAVATTRRGHQSFDG